MSEKKVNKNEKEVNGGKKNPNTIECNDGTIVKASCVYKKDTKMLKRS